jgi:acyl-CoA synthetase (AMP-forming)/AMP-acid ligase II
MDLALTTPLHKALSECPGKCALVFGDQRFTYAMFIARVARCAAALRWLGMEANDRIGILALHSHRYVEYFYGTWWGGGVVNPVNVRWSSKEMAYSLDDCHTRILLVDEHFSASVTALKELSTSLQTIVYIGEGPVPAGMRGYELLIESFSAIPDAIRQGDDLAAVMYTGGTTGFPKGVMLSHRNLVSNALDTLIAIPRPAGSTTIITAALFHIGGCCVMLQAIQIQQRLVVIPTFDEEEVFRALRDERATEMFLVPTMIRRLVMHPRFAEFDVSSLRLMLYGAAPIDSTLLAEAMQAFPNASFYQAYGMTECAPTICILGAADHVGTLERPARLLSAGLPMSQVQMRVVDADDRDLSASQIGEIVARGPMVMQGYWNQPESTAAALRGGWMHTGDAGFLDEDGYLFVVDRVKDMIVTGGENVYSAEVENAIAQHEEVLQAAVIGIPDDRFGERVHAFVVPRAGSAPSEIAIVEHCRMLIAAYKCPRSVEFRQALPLTAAGKIQKTLLREPFWKGRERRIN